MGTTKTAAAAAEQLDIGPLLDLVRAAGTCPGAYCGGAALDARRTVVLGDWVVCTPCWANLETDVQQAVVDAARHERVELIDGPALHGDPAVIPDPTLLQRSA